jgi:glyoxylase-like metal-dependent hydrolase (beta-lactamase superfamily II)
LKWTVAHHKGEMVGPPPDTWAVAADKSRAFELAPGLWRLRLPLSWPGIGATNAYALKRADGGLVLVDCGGGGDPSTWAALERAIRDSGHELADIREIVITHYHSDHIGALDWLTRRTDAAILGHPAHGHFTDAAERPDELAAIRGRRARAEGVPADRLHVFTDTREETEGIGGPVHPTRPLRDGDVVKSVHGSWQVIETPGHCPSHICLYEPTARLLIVGDLLSAEFHPWFDYGYSADPVRETFESLERVRTLGEPALVLPGHGRPLQDMPALVQMHVDSVADLLQTTQAAVGAGSSTGYEVTGAVFGDDLGEIDLALRFTETVAYLGHLRRTGKIVREIDGDGLYRYRLTE